MLKRDTLPRMALKHLSISRQKTLSKQRKNIYSVRSLQVWLELLVQEGQCLSCQRWSVLREEGPICSSILRSFIATCSYQSAKAFLRWGMPDCSYMQILAATYSFRYQKAVEMALTLANEICRVSHVS